MEKTLAVVIPTLNEAQSIGDVIDGVRDACKDESLTVVVVDGGSSDGTGAIAKSKGATVIRQRGTGYGDALWSGFRYCCDKLSPEILVMIDGDSTYDPLDIPKLVDPIISDDADMVIGDRLGGLKKGAMTFKNRMGNSTLSWFARVTLDLTIHDTQCGLRAFRRELFDYLEFASDGMSFATEMIMDAHLAGARIGEVPISYRPRVGTTKLSPLKDGFSILGTIIRLTRDTKPLLFFGAVSAIFALFGLLFGIEVTVEWLQTGGITRLPTVVLAVLLLIGAMQLFTIGLVADMMKRVRRRRLN